MRPGEIFGLRWANLEPPYADVRQRVYHGEVDSPKSPKSIRKAAFKESLLCEVARWRELSVSTAPDAWVFPSETGKSPLRTDNCWHRHIGPKLKAVVLEGSTFRCYGKVVADQLGHTRDANHNVYTRVAFERQAEAVNQLDSVYRVN